METIYCSFGCGRPAIKQFQNGKYCCELHYASCPAIRKKISETARNRDTKTSRMRKLIKDGKAKCKYCGEKANYLIHMNSKLCCSETAKGCPSYKKYFSDLRKKLYKNNPEYLEFQRNHVKKMGKDKKIQEKKQETMIRLHRGDCEPCKEFQKKYKESHEKRKDEKWNELYDEAVNKWGFDAQEMRTLTKTQLYNKCKYKRKYGLHRDEEV